MSNYDNIDTMTSLPPCEPRRVTTPISHSSEQGTLPTASLISKQVAPYRITATRERVDANLNRRRAATEPGNGEAARPVLVDGEGGLW